MYQPNWKGKLLTDPVATNSLALSSILVAACMACVGTSFAPPAPARIYAINDEVVNAVIDRFTFRSIAYYNKLKSNQCTIEYLKGVLGLRKSPAGQPESLVGKKSELVDRIFHSDRGILMILYRPLIAEAIMIIDHNLALRVADTEAETHLAVEIKTQRGSKHRLRMIDFQNFAPGQPISTSCMDYVIALMQHRTDFYCFGLDKENPMAPPLNNRTLYLPGKVWRDGAFNAASFSAELAWYGGDAAGLCRVKKIHLVDPPCPERSSWGVITINLPNGKVQAYYATQEAAEAPGAIERVTAVMNAVKTTLNAIIPNTMTGECMPTIVVPDNDCNFDLDESDFNSGMYVITYLNYCYHNLPFAFSACDIPVIRRNMAHSIIKSQL